MDIMRFTCWCFLCLALFSTSVRAGEQVVGATSIHAAQIIENADASRTFLQPRLRTGSGNPAEQLRISRGVPGICALFGMDGFLQDHVIRSDEIKDGVELSAEGLVVGIRTGYYIESVTCTAEQPYWPKLLAESIQQNADGSITAYQPIIHSGPESFRIVSGFTAGACRLLGFNAVLKHSLVWSEQRAAGISISLDGRIYAKATDTYLEAISCRNVSQEKYSSAERALFDQKVREHREQNQADGLGSDEN
ncbi:MAG: hypothetical protein QGH93_06550 [Gammaproteobacteria bacterium]|jgi:hypothetical protein|nr:hypothetical protein [Chromatiales bacterium]MDP6674495.1 hypothetical protein [Gammaproteobacteria bacterium]